MTDEGPRCQRYGCDLLAVVRYAVLAGDKDEIWKRDACALHAAEAHYRSFWFAARPDLRHWRLSLMTHHLRTA
jgi:hypothetical protein